MGMVEELRMSVKENRINVGKVTRPVGLLSGCLSNFSS